MAEHESKNMDSEFVKCPKCGKMVEKKRVAKMRYVCYECNAYFRVSTRERIRMVADKDSFEPWFEDMPISNPLQNEDYEAKIEEVRAKTGLHEAFTVGQAKIFGEPIVLGICDARFLMGSMGYVVGEKVTRAIEKATEMELPVFIFCCSGGARMQEGIVSLMQMAKTSAAIKRHSDAGLLYCTILTDPTTGGVTASFAMLGDIIMAEPGALIGFAGPRVIKQTIGRDLPKGAQSAEFLLEHGLIDGIITRKDTRKMLHFLIVSHKKKEGYANFTDEFDFKFAPTEIAKEKQFKSNPWTAWQKVKAARQFDRPSAMDYINYIFDSFIESHGDRHFCDDHAIIGGVGFIDGQPITVIADQKGKTYEEAVMRNFGMPIPEGYRKALRLMKQAEKFNRPIVSFVNTSGAYPGLESEERNIGEAIARNLCEMSALKVPVLCIMIGEGGSGGALATAVGNQVWMMENATYSILSPEGYASILWKDSNRAQEASEKMKITAQDLKELGIIEKIIPEFGGADEGTVSSIAGFMKENLIEFLKSFDGVSRQEIADMRYDRFRNM